MAPLRDASTAKDGALARLLAVLVAMAAPLPRIALGLATFALCAWLWTPSAQLAGGSNEAAVRASTSTSSHDLRDDSGRPVDDLNAVESDLDEDDDDDRDDSTHDVVAHAALAFRWLPAACHPERAHSGAAQIDPSRFVVDEGLPRGPPALRA